MDNAIDTWLKSGCNYAQGIALYELHGTDNFLKRMFAKGENHFNRQKLNSALTEIKNLIPQESGEFKSPPSFIKGGIVPGGPTPYIDKKFTVLVGGRSTGKTFANEQQKKENAELPAVLQVIKQRDAIYGEIRSLHPYLTALPEGEKLRELAERICKLGKKSVEAWALYDHLIANGEPPVPEPVLVDVKLINELENLRKNLGKAENRYKLQNPKNPKTAQLITEQKAKMELLRKEIDQQKKGAEK
ncbi:hypothetical protein [Mucilaginibacter sp.]